MRVLKAMLISLVLLAMPTAAFAVNVSSSDGSGNQSVTTKYSNGFAASGSLKSTSGQPVYFSGDVVFDSYPDSACGRYTTDTMSTTPMSRGGDCLVTTWFVNADGAKYQVCKNVSFAPDVCGSWSSTERF